MNKRLKYTLLMGGIVLLLLTPLIFYRVLPEAVPSVPEPHTVAVQFFNPHTQFLSKEVRVMEEGVTSPAATLEAVTHWLHNPSLSQHTSLLELVGLESVLWSPLSPEGLDMSVTVILSFDPSYYTLSNAQQLLIRTGLVQTFLGLHFVDQVELRVSGQPLLDSLGQVVEPFVHGSFLLSPEIGAHIFARTTQWVNLYFVHPNGQHLYQEQIWMDVDQELSLEETVLSELLARGAVDNLLFFPSDLSLIEISTIDHVAYLDFNARLDMAPDAGAQAQLLSIYAIVNTLTGLGTGIEEVEFFVESERISDHVGYVDLSESFVRNSALVHSN